MLERTLKSISSRNNLDERSEEPSGFKRIANSIRRKMTNVFPRKNSTDQDLINENYIDEKLHGTGKTNFDKQNSGFVEIRLDPSQLAQILKESNKPYLNGKTRSVSCPRESWISNVVSVSTLPMNTQVRNSTIVDECNDIRRSDTPDSALDNVSINSTVLPQVDVADNDENLDFYLK